MTTEEILALSIIFTGILLTLFKLEKNNTVTKKEHEKALLELYDRITELENKLNNN